MQWPSACLLSCPCAPVAWLELSSPHCLKYVCCLGLGQGSDYAPGEPWGGVDEVVEQIMADMEAQLDVPRGLVRMRFVLLILTMCQWSMPHWVDIGV